MLAVFLGILLLIVLLVMVFIRSRIRLAVALIGGRVEFKVSSSLEAASVFKPREEPESILSRLIELFVSLYVS